MNPAQDLRSPGRRPRAPGFAWPGAERRPRRGALAGIAASVLLPLLAGCGLLDRSERQPFQGYARIAVIEFFDRSGYTGTGPAFSQHLRDQLTECSSETDFILLPQAAFEGLQDPFDAGALPLKVLVTARKDHRADAVIVGRIDSHSPYAPPSVHVSLKVVDTAQARVLYQSSQGYDAQARRVQRDIEEYYEDHVGADQCRFGPHIFTVSPRYFLQYVAHRCAQRIAEAL